jgi:hypothetical protein
MTKNNILLISGSIDITAFQIPYTKLTGLNDRLQQYIDSIDYAIVHYHRVNHIIFCENTGYQCDFSELQEKARVHGKTFEIIQFSGNFRIIQEKGKGYGEGEIIEYAFTQSEVLRNSIYFYKLTGRVCVRNMDQVMDATQSNNAFIFLSDLKTRSEKRYVRTVIYKADTALYKQVLMDAYQEVDDTRKHYLENVFYSRLADVPANSFGKYPVLIGIKASTGKAYQSKIGLLKCLIYNRLNFYSNVEKTALQKVILSLIKGLKIYLK